MEKYFENIDFNTLINDDIIFILVLKKYEELKFGEEFELSDLFPKLIWEKIPTGVRISKGEEFSKQVDAKRFPVEKAGKKSNNHIIYKKI